MGNTAGGLAIVGGVDTHADTHHAAALDSLGRLLGTREFTANAEGYRAMVQWLQSLGAVTGIGVEGTGCYGADLTRYLRSCSISVVEINRPNRQDRRLRGKSDPLDAERAARRLLATTRHVLPKDSTTVVESIRVLRVARSGAVKARSAALNQLKDLITTAPDLLRAELRSMTLKAAAARVARFRNTPVAPVDPVQAQHRPPCRGTHRRDRRSLNTIERTSDLDRTNHNGVVRRVHRARRPTAGHRGWQS